MNLSQTFKPLWDREKLAFWAGLILVFVTWSGLWLGVTHLVERWSTLESPGAGLPALGLVLLSVGLFAHKMGQAGGHKSRVVWWFAGTNLVLGLVSLGVGLSGEAMQTGWLRQLQPGLSPAGPGSWLIFFLFSLLGLNLFIFQSQVNMEAYGNLSRSRRRLALLLGLDGLMIGVALWFTAIQAALTWLDRLFYPYTPVVITGVALVILMLIMIGTLAAAPPPLINEGYDAPGEDGRLL